MITDDAAEIRDVVQNWVLWRDSGDWARFATVWHEDGHMTATWFQGSAAAFIDASIEASRVGAEHGLNVLHQLGGTSVDVAGDRAIAQSRMSILQRATVDEVEVDVTCVGRFYDFFVRDEHGWRIRRRQPIYEKDWLTVLDPGALLSIDSEQLNRYPTGYRYLAYVQVKSGMAVKKGLPGRIGPEVERLYAQGRDWLGDAA
ncbi:MAG TPA: nuclear transport factor 2 family protein [Pseudonocardiaceae bacterium]|nr:nuclear transport factor 2 family protein [Pseudonocardiaceae bacterium]